MRLKEFTLPIDPEATRPLYLQIAMGMADAIQKGRLQPGSALPGSRALAEHLDVSRSTVIAAFETLEAQGWIQARAGSGHFVLEHLPEPALSLSDLDAGNIRRPDFDLPTRQDLATDQMLQVCRLSESLPDPRLLSVNDLGRAYHRALLQRRDGVLDYGDPRGHQDLRKALAIFLGERRGILASPESILVTRGSLMSLNLLAQGLLKAEEWVAVEDPGNPVAWQCFRSAKARLMGIPVDSKGLVVDALEEKLRTERIRILYLSPRYQIPTTVMLSQARRDRLIQLARQHRFAIVEEDSEADYAYEGRSLLPMAAGEITGNVIHLCSLSRLLAPGVRLGFLVGPKAVVDRLAKLRQRLEHQGDQVLERAMAELFEAGEIQRHIQRARKLYRERRDAALKVLHQLFPAQLEMDAPDGGLSLWIRTARSMDLEGWRARCRDLGIQFQSGSSYVLEQAPPAAFRLGFASHDADELKDLLTRMKEMLG